MPWRIQGKVGAPANPLGLFYNMKNYVIYDHISPNGKHYIGQTGNKVEYRWGKNGANYLRKQKNGQYAHPAFAPAILKYG